MIKILSGFFRVLPLPASLWIARRIGLAWYHLLPKKRAVVYANLKTAFSATRLPPELHALSRAVFVNLAQSFVELLCMPKIKRFGFKRFVDVRGREHVDQAMASGKGLILLAIHSGNWELGNVLNSLFGYPYHVVAKAQPNVPGLGLLLKECRSMGGGHTIALGSATKDIIRALKRNEIVTVVFDQGGAGGIPVKFLGKTAAMSTGAIRLALKYGCAVCPAWIVRRPAGGHALAVFKGMTIASTGSLEKDIETNVQRASDHFGQLLEEHPQEYLWPYKVFKYTTEAHIMVLDDGNQEHLRQAQDMAGTLTARLLKEGKSVKTSTRALAFHSTLGARSFRLFSSLARAFPFLRDEGMLKIFFTDACYRSLMGFKADFVISCGTQAEGLNFILSKNHLAKSIML